MWHLRKCCTAALHYCTAPYLQSVVHKPHRRVETVKNAVCIFSSHPCVFSDVLRVKLTGEKADAKPTIDSTVKTPKTQTEYIQNICIDPQMRSYIATAHLAGKSACIQPNVDYSQRDVFFTSIKYGVFLKNKTHLAAVISSSNALWKTIQYAVDTILGSCIHMKSLNTFCFREQSGRESMV